MIIKGDGGRATPGCTVKVGTLTQERDKTSFSGPVLMTLSTNTDRWHPSHLLVPSVCPPSFILSRSCGGGRGTMMGWGSGASAKLWCFLLCFLCFLCFRLWTLCRLELPSPAEERKAGIVTLHPFPLHTAAPPFVKEFSQFNRTTNIKKPLKWPAFETINVKQVQHQYLDGNITHFLHWYQLICSRPISASR